MHVFLTLCSPLFTKKNLPRSAYLQNSKNAKGRLPGLTAWYEGVRTPDLFVLGAASHARDYRVSAGGFIHGFRYTGKSTILSVTQIDGWEHMTQ